MNQRTQEHPKVETSEKDIDALIERIRQTIRKQKSEKDQHHES